MTPEPADETDSTQTRTRNARKRAQLWMTKGGLVRDDSDDELGHEDHPWVWIYDSNSDEIKDEAEGAQPAEEVSRSGRRRQSRTKNTKRRQQIIGARMGQFECRLGQVVLLKSPEAGKDWVGIITEFVEEEDDEAEGEVIKSANIMWFASPDEFMSTRNKRRADALPNEQYLTADFNVNPLTSINGRATVMSKDAFYAKYPNGAPPKGKDALAEYNKCIVCRRGVNQLQGRYTPEFVWEEVYREDRIFDLINLIKDGLKAAKKRKQVDSNVSECSPPSGIRPSNNPAISTSIPKRKKMTTLRLPPQGNARKWPQTPHPSHDATRR